MVASAARAVLSDCGGGDGMELEGGFFFVVNDEEEVKLEEGGVWF